MKAQVELVWQAGDRPPFPPQMSLLLVERSIVLKAWEDLVAFGAHME